MVAKTFIILKNYWPQTKINMPWQQLIVCVPKPLAEELSDTLMAEAALSVTMSADQTQADSPQFQYEPDEHPMWPHTRIEALFPNDWPITQTLSSLRTQYPSLEWQHHTLADANWVQLTQAQFPAQHIANKLWLLPSWLDEAQYNSPKFRIDPGLAFGTGTHPTTKLCLNWLACHPPAGQNVLDFGCGSGILSLAALALGAKKVWAIDHDPQAITATHNNAKLNHIDDAQLIAQTSIDADITVPCVIANILAKPLKNLAQQIIDHCQIGGDVILSGLLSEEVDDICAHYTPDLSHIKTDHQEGWAAIWFKKEK